MFMLIDAIAADSVAHRTSDWHRDAPAVAVIHQGDTLAC